MPALEKDWRTSPFQLTGVNGFLYGRGASDNKGPIIALYAMNVKRVNPKPNPKRRLSQFVCDQGAAERVL